MRILKAAAIYFALVFGAGFALGAVRVPLLVPRLGERLAELLELPFMVAIVVLVSRARQRRTAGLRPRQQLAVGGLAFAFMLAAECALGAALQGRSPIEVLLSHDPASGALYYSALGLFAVLPAAWAVAAGRSAPADRPRPSAGNSRGSRSPAPGAAATGSRPPARPAAGATS